MLQQVRSLTKSMPLWDRILVLCLSLYSLGLFLPSITAVERIGLVVATIISCFGGRWRIAVRYLKHPVFALLAVFLCWLALSFFWSAAPDITLSSWTSVFKDYFIFVIPMLYLLAHTQRRQLLSLAFALSGAVIVVLNGAQYLNELFTDPALLLNIKAHRGWAHPLVFFLPFSMQQAGAAKGRQAALWYGLFSLEALMIFASGARGAWLALIVILALWGLLREHRRLAGILLAIGLTIAAVSYVMLPANLFKDRIAQGADTSLRTTGTWGPALEMMDERPWQGFGFGKEIFNNEFNQRAPTKELWSIKKSKGPHSILFEAGFAGGYPGLILLSMLFITTFVYGWRAVFVRPVVEEKAFALAAMASFSGFYITRGAFESVHWGPMIILLTSIAYVSRPNNALNRQ